MLVGPVYEPGAVIYYDDASVFRIENDPTYCKLEHLSTCDFVALDEKEIGRIVLIECKKSAPQPIDPEKFIAFLKKVTLQFLHALLLIIADMNGRRLLGNAPNAFRKSWTRRYEFRFVLYMTEFETTWCQSLQDALRSEMLPLTTGYAKSDVYVVNKALSDRAGWFLSPSLTISLGEAPSE